MTDIKLRVWFIIDEGNHDGYCSDASNECHEITRTVEDIEIPDNLSMDIVREDGFLTSISGLSYLEYKESCGYCEVYSSKSIVYAQIVDATENTLEDEIEEINQLYN